MVLDPAAPVRGFLRDPGRHLHVRDARRGPGGDGHLAPRRGVPGVGDADQRGAVGPSRPGADVPERRPVASGNRDRRRDRARRNRRALGTAADDGRSRDGARDGRGHMGDQALLRDRAGGRAARGPPGVRRGRECRGAVHPRNRRTGGRQRHRRHGRPEPIGAPPRGAAARGPRRRAGACSPPRRLGRP